MFKICVLSVIKIVRTTFPQFKLAAVCALLFAVLPALHAAYPIGGNASIDVRHYNLSFAGFNYRAGSAEASAVIELQALANLTVAEGICLDFTPPGGSVAGVTAVTLNNTPVNYTLEIYAGAEDSERATYLKIIPPAPLTSGSIVTVRVDYAGAMVSQSHLGSDTWGMAFHPTLDVMATMNQPNSAHLWFPCNDTPADKASVDVFATVALDQSAISVGTLAGVSTNGASRTFHWSTTNQVAPYLIALYAGDYTHVPDVGGALVPVEAWHYSGTSASWAAGARRARDNMLTFTNCYGPYPFEKYAHVQFWSAADYMEHQTASAMRDANNVQYVAHELAHQWWGNQVTCNSWDDLWLNESFACYSEALASTGRDSRDTAAAALENLRSRDDCNWSIPLNAPNYGSLGTMFDHHLTYNRGAWMLHHLRSYLDEELFWPALLSYRDRYAGRSATTAQFRDALAESAYDDLTQRADFVKFFNRHISAGQPQLDLSWYAETVDGNTRVFMRNTRGDGYDCPDVVVTQVTFDAGSPLTITHRWAKTNSVAVVEITDRSFASLSVDAFGDYPMQAGGDLSVVGSSDQSDNDGDGLPDAWETVLLGTTDYGAADDPDGDGVPNAQAYLDGIVPLGGGAPSQPPIAYEGFEDYAAGANFVGCNGGTGWSGAWANFYGWDSGDGAVAARAQPLGYMAGNVFISGGTNAALLADLTADTLSYVARPIPAQSGDVYLSALVMAEKKGTHYAFGTPPSDKESGFVAGQDFSAIMNDDYPTQKIPYVTNASYFVVTRFSWSGSAYTNVSYWVNPVSATTAGAPSGSYSNGSFTDFSKIYFGSHQSKAGDRVYFDEFRVGSSWEQVVPTGTLPTIVIDPDAAQVEIGGSVGVQVSLSSMPAHNVTVTITNRVSAGDLSASTNAMVFTTENWSIPQSVVIASTDDEDPPQSNTFDLSCAPLAAVALVITEAAAPVPTYAVTVTLTPSEAVAAGAQWALSDAPTVWRNSGSTVQLTNGTYIAHFHAATGFEAPTNYTLAVSGGAVAYTQSYTALTPPPPPPGFSCHDDFGGNATGWPTGSAWSGNMAVTKGPIALPLIYSNAAVYVNGGSDAVKITTNVGGSSSTYYRRAIPTQTNTFYISFLARYNSTVTGSWDYLGCGQKAANKDSGAALGHVGTSSGCSTVYINDGASKEKLCSESPQANRTYLLVAKYTWDATAGGGAGAFTSLTAYLNPLSATNESAEASATVTGTVIAPFSSVDFQYYGTVDAAFDEIRVGSSWADVVPANTPQVTPEALTIDLIYDQAAQSTAQWGIVENSVTNWHASGASLMLDPGSYRIVYSSSFQSKKPADEDITITSGQGRALTRQYRQAEPVMWQGVAAAAIDIKGLGDSYSSTNNYGLLAKYFGVYPALQSVETARTNGSISISESSDRIGSLDRAERPQDQTWVFDWRSLAPTLRTNTVDWGESDWIGLHTPSIGFDIIGSYAPGGDVHPYNSKVDHTTTDGSASPNDFYPSGGEYYDLEAMYFDNDKDYFYISIISSAPFSNEWVNAAGKLCRDLGIPETASSRTNSVLPAGDIAFDFGLNTPVSEKDGATFSYDFGIDLTHEVRDTNQWFTLNHTYSNSASSTATFNYKRPPVRDLDAGTSLYRTENADWFLALGQNAAINAGGERTNFDPQDSASTATHKGEVQSKVYRLDFPDGRLENDLPTYVYEFVVPRSLFGGAEKNRPYIKVRFLPTTCRNDGNNADHVFYLDEIEIDEPAGSGYGAIGNRAWFDCNYNGIQDDLENNNGLTNIQVVAISQATGVACTNYTDEAGFYLFDNMPAGYYDIYFGEPDLYKLTRYNLNLPGSPPPTTGEPARGNPVIEVIYGIESVYVAANETNFNADIGLYLPMNVNGYVFIDNNDNLIFDISNENERTTGVTVYLAHKNGTILSNQVDSSGYYEFMGVPPGEIELYMLDAQSNVIGIPEAGTPAASNPMRNRAATNLNSKASIDLTLESAASPLSMDSEPQNFGFDSNPLSTQIDFRVYATQDSKVMIELATVDENGKNEITIDAMLTNAWVRVAIVPADLIHGNGSYIYTVEAFGLTPGESYRFRIVDEADHIFESGLVLVALASTLAVEAVTLIPQMIKVAFKTEQNSTYLVLVCETMGTSWKVEHVQYLTTDKVWSALSDEPFQGGSGEITEVLIPRNNRVKAFFKIIKVE
ncbi:MAG: M1 family aminopeptidase [Kiritimatiellia bacterium]